MAKEYHIVYAEIAKNVLLLSHGVDLSDDNIQLIILKDNLAEGRLFDLKTSVGIDERIKWFEDFYNEKDSYHDRQGHAHNAQKKLSEVRSNDKVYIWLGNEGNEYVWKAAVLDFFQGIDVFLFDLDWEDVVVKGKFGELNVYSLNMCNHEQVQTVKKRFKQITVADRLQWSKIWNDLYKNNTDLRILNKTILEEVDISFFDNMLLNNCTSEYQKGAYVVGMTLSDIYYKYKGAGIGDYFMFERLEQLARLGILEIVNRVKRESAYDFFDVRLIS